MAEVPVTLWLSEEEDAALSLQARRYQRTPEEHVWTWVRADLTDAIKEFQAQRWNRRRQTIEGNTTVAATVDAAAGST